MRIAIIGAGASGMMAAVAASGKNEVVLLEKNDRIGKKILATGNGRCNLTNINADIKNYHGEDVSFLNYAIDNFWVGETLDAFSEMGLIYKVEDEGKVYPYSDTAASVLDVLRFKLDRLAVRVEYGFDACKIEKQRNGFKIFSYDQRTINCDRVIVATGGKAMPSSGSNGSGYALLEAFGHSCNRLFPSLVQVKLKGKELKPLNGLKSDVKITVKSGKTVLKTAMGELLFTDYGLSGPVIFSLSRFAGEYEEPVCDIDFMPEYSFDDICQMLEKQRGIMSTAEEIFAGILNRRLGQVILKNSCEIKMNSKITEITDRDIKNIAKKIKCFTVVWDGTMSWNNAQVTAGGLRVSDFYSKTMESRLVKGVYATGEILDIDGDCGGYNLQWAWSSGYIAGRAAAEN